MMASPLTAMIALHARCRQRRAVSCAGFDRCLVSTMAVGIPASHRDTYAGCSGVWCCRQAAEGVQSVTKRIYISTWQNKELRRAHYERVSVSGSKLASCIIQDL